MTSAALALLQYLNTHSNNRFKDSLQTLRDAFRGLLPELDEVIPPGNNDSKQAKEIRETYDNLVNQKLGGIGNKIGLILIAVLCLLMVTNLFGHSAKVLPAIFVASTQQAAAFIDVADYVVLGLNAVLVLLVVLTALRLWNNAVQVKNHEKKVAEAIRHAKSRIEIAREAANVAKQRGA